MAGKISEYTNAVATFADGDLVDVSKRISTSPDTFQSQKLEFAQFQAFIQANASNILNTNGLTLGGNYSHDLDSNTLTFTNGTLNVDSNIILNSNVNAPNLPTASTGLSAGDFWNENGIVRVGTSGAGVSTIYTANGTLTGDRTVTLGDNKLTFDFDAVTSSEVAPINFEFESGSFDGYTRWSQNGGVTIRSGGNAPSLTVQNKVGTNNFKAKSAGGGYLGLEGSASNVWRINNGDSEGGIEFGRNAFKFYFGGGVMHRIQQGGSGGGAHFYESGISGNLGYFVVGNNTILGTEDISLQGQTAIKGAGTTGSSLLSLYDGASTPVKVAEFSDNGKFEMLTTTSGILLPRLTTAEKIAISTPDTNLVVFDTTLNSLQRWNGTAWVSMASGYGIVQVLRDSDNGNPTFYSDLQSGLETCKTAGSRNTIVLCSDVTTTTSININRGGSGLGNGYEYETLTIDFNGFTLTNNQADSSFAFDVSFGNIVAENRQITFKNGRVLRTSGTGTHYALHCDEGENDGHLFMSNMYWLCENSHTIKLEIDEFDSSYKDFGGSIFESNGGTCLRIQHYSCKNFTCISNSASNCFSLVENSKATNFEVLNTSTGNGINVGGTNDITFFKVKTISGIGIDCGDDFEGVCSQFYIETTTGEGIDTTGTNSGFDLKFSHFVIKSENATCIDSNHNNTIFSNFAVSNDSDTKPTISEVNNGDRKYINGTVINYGSNFCFIATNVKDIELNNVTLISRGGTPCNVSVDNALYNVTFNHCSFIAQSNVSTANAVFIGTTIGSVGFLNCSFDVANASANCLNATTSRTISVGNSGFKGATTPINSNITVSLTTAPDSNGNYTL